MLQVENARVVEEIDVTNMTHDEWMALRRRHLTSTNAAPLIGDREIFPYNDTPLSIYMQKRGELSEPDLSENPYVQWGLLLEPVVAQRFAALHPEWEVTKATTFYSRTDVGFPMGSSLDYLLRHKETGERGILEIKTAGRDGSEKKNPYLLWGPSGTDIVPAMYKIQVHQQEACFPVPLEKVYLAALIGGNDYREYEIKIEPTLQAGIVQIERAFWKNHIEQGVMPDPQSYADAIAFVGSLREEVVQLTEKQAAPIVDLATVRAQKSALEERENELKRDVVLTLGGAKKAVGPDGRHLCTISESKQNRVSADRVRALLGERVGEVTEQTTVIQVRPAKGILEQ